MRNVVDMNVEYIMTNGKQFILTDWIPLIDTKIEMYFHVKDTLNKDGLNNQIFNSRGENNTIAFSINNGGNAYEFDVLYLWNNKSFNSGGIVKSISIGSYIYTQTPLLLYMSKDSIGYYIDNVFKKEPLDLRTKPCTTPLKLFTEYGTDCYNRAKLYIYGIRCWNNGILERDFVPAKRNGIYGLYDKVNKKFLRSSSGVDFLGKDK